MKTSDELQKDFDTAKASLLFAIYSYKHPALLAELIENLLEAQKQYLGDLYY